MSAGPAITAFCEAMEREGLANIADASPERLVAIGEDLDLLDATIARLREAIAAKGES